MGENRFGEALRRAREAAGLRQEDVAALVSTEDAKVTGAAIGNWERGDNPPRDAQRVFRIEQVLSLGPGELSHHLGFVPFGSEPPLVEDALLADATIGIDVRDALLAAYRSARQRTESG